MKFDQPATKNPIDQLKVVGQPVDRIDGPLKATGTAPYANDRHDVAANQAHGYIVGSAIPKGRITSMDVAAARAAPGAEGLGFAIPSATLKMFLHHRDAFAFDPTNPNSGFR